MSKTRGEMTSAIDFAPDKSLTVSKTIGADSKINDFPDPVDYITKTSWPLINFSNASRCKSIKLSILNVSTTLWKAQLIKFATCAIFDIEIGIINAKLFSRQKTAGGMLIGRVYQ